LGLQATLRSATARSRFWPFRRRPAGKFRNGPRFAATAPRLCAPSTWPCLRARRAPRRAPVRATLCAARRAALALVSWVPPPGARWRASSSRYRTGRRSRANALTGRSPRCASRRASLRSGRRCARRLAAPTAVCREMASSSSSSSSWLLPSFAPKDGSTRAAGDDHSVAQEVGCAGGCLTPVTRINGKDQDDKVADVLVSSGHGGNRELGDEGERGSAWVSRPCRRDAVDLALRLHIEAHHPAFEAGLGRRVAREHERIVAGHHVVGRAGELFERLVAFNHFGHVVGN